MQKTQKTRIELTDSLIEIIMKMSDGNPGAVTCLAEVVKNEPRIDPDSALVGYGTLLNLDMLGIYGSNIWVVFKDVCGQNIVNFITLFRANQLGYISDVDIKTASENRGRIGDAKIDFALLTTKIHEICPNFAKAV